MCQWSNQKLTFNSWQYFSKEEVCKELHLVVTNTYVLIKCDVLYSISNLLPIVLVNNAVKAPIR